MSHVIVIGGGVIGALSAYYLDRAGLRVTLMEKQTSLANGASGMNAAQLSYTYVSPLGNPGIYPLMLRALSRQMPDVCVTQWMDPQLWNFGWRLLLESLQKRYDRNQAALLALALESRRLMDEFVQRHDLSFAHQYNGKLHLFVSEKQRRNAIAFSNKVAPLGIVQELLTSDECLARVPALKDRQGPLFGGLISYADEGGDCRLFTQALPALYSGNVRVLLDTPVRRVIIENNKATGVEMVGGDRMTADAVLVANGAHAYYVLREAGMRLPLYPIKGYSTTLPMDGLTLECNITDHYRRCVFAPLEGRLRVSCGMHFSGYDGSVTPEMTAHFKTMIAGVFPQLKTADLKLSTGLRPYLPTSVPRWGETGIKGLHMNVGHAMLGWTLAQATCKRAAETLATSL